MAVAQNTYAVKWFQGRELNMVFGLQLSFSRVVSLFCFVFLRRLQLDEWLAHLPLDHGMLENSAYEGTCTSFYCIRAFHYHPAIVSVLLE